MGSSKLKLCSFLISEELILLTLTMILALVIDLNMGVAELVHVKWELFTVSRFIIGATGISIVMSFIIVIGVWYLACRVMRI